MKFYIANKAQEGFRGNEIYVIVLLKHLIKVNGHQLVSSMFDADYCLLSISNIRTYNELIALSKKLKGKVPIVVGGHTAFMPYTLLAYADYVCVGHAFEFFRDVESVTDLNSLPYIATREKDTIYPSQYIDWHQIPLVRLSTNTWSFLHTVGCPYRCAMCLTAWGFKLQKNPYSKALIAKVPKKGKPQIQLIMTDIDLNIPAFSHRQSSRLDTFLRNPQKFSKYRVLRLGIEAPIYSTRRKLGKNITDEQIKEVFIYAEKLKIALTLYFIAGLNTYEEFISFCDLFPLQTRQRHHVVFNYLDCNPNTPFECFDISKLIELDLRRLSYQYQVAYTCQFHTANLTIKNTLYNTILERAHWRDAPSIWALHTKFNSRESLFTLLEKHGFEDYIHSLPYRNPVVGFANEQKNRKMLYPSDFNL